MAYNFLRTASYIRNSFLCVYDSLSGYSSDFHVNGDVDGWDTYTNIYLYGCWSGVLFGTAFDREIYISRTEVFEAIEAEDYYFLNIMMKITNNNPDKVVQGLTTGRVQWARIDDGTFNSDKQYDFDLIADDKWHLYAVNLGPAQWWQGDINNLRFYPFIDGWKGDQFAIKFIKITALNKYSCTNTQCSYYLNYKHNCPGAGSRGSCRAETAATTYTTVSGVSDSLIINIDGYGEEIFELGNNENVRGVDMAKLIAGKISSVNVGGYNFTEVEYDEYYKLKIYSGTVGSTSSVEILYSKAAEVLGFYSDSIDVSENESGTSSATGFDYASSRFLTASEINKLTDGRTGTFAYEHDPLQYSVEGGRRDYIEMGTSSLISAAQDSVYYETLSNVGRTIIDLSHPFNNNGKVHKIYVYGQADETAKIKILRRNRSGLLRVIHSIDFPAVEPNKIYTARPNIYRIDCNVIVNKGDLIGIYSADLFVGRSLTGLPDATFYQINGDVSGEFDPGQVNAFGLTGFAIYARGDRLQNNTILDIDLGRRTNIEELNIHGSEDVAYFEYNIASCLDVTWDVDLFGGTHWHRGWDALASNWWAQEHTNLYYGKTCLDDSIRTADNGKQGDSFYADNGIGTTGDHAYFYVNGDAEWLYKRTCDGTTEYCGQYISNVSTSQFDRDPIAFTMYFPYGYSTSIHKTMMYFKERNNFRSIMLSYSPFPGYFKGDADISSFNKVSSYNSVTLDGIIYLPDDDYVIIDYLFENPTNQDIIYATKGVSDPINWEEYKAALQADWTTIEHTFDPVECIGFRIYTDHHYSTKISELEVYSKMDTTPSLVDNVTLTLSDYGEDWVPVTFNEVSSTKITGFLGGAPRYLRLEFEAATEFFINEIECFVGDQVKTEECSDIILLDNAKTGVVNNSTPIVLENVYGKPYDLSVDIPREVSENDNLIFWSKLGSYDEINNPEIGPGCILNKSAAYSLRNDNAQCAINVPCYGLINLINDKESYYTNNDIYYHSYGVLASGISVNFCTTGYYDKNLTEISFPAVSSKYWKFFVTDATVSGIINDLIAFYADVVVPIDKIYYSSSGGSTEQPYVLDSNGDAIPDYPDVFFDSGVGFGFSFSSSEAVDKIRLVHGDAVINDLEVYVSTNNTNNYVLIADGSDVVIDPSNTTRYSNFFIDLEKRHDIGIIRNYGSNINKIVLSVGANVNYSNTQTSSVEDVVWDNTTSEDARWLKIPIICNGSLSCLDKLGIYPDITTAYCQDGGYNCEWQSLGTKLSDYNNSINVAYGTSASGTNYWFSDYYPTNAVNGTTDAYFAQSCWGFQAEDGVDPFIEIDFEGVYTIDRVVLYHGYNPNDNEYKNTDYTFSITLSGSGGDFTTIFTETSNTDHYRVHTFTPVQARRARLTITGYDSGRFYVFDEELNNYILFLGSFLREIEIYTYVSEGYIDSENWPVVCMNLLDQFSITSHALINKDVEDTTTDWDNNEDFFKYSDNVFDDPKKVEFDRAGSEVEIFSSGGTTDNLAGSTIEYEFGNTYFLEGIYNIEWQAYSAEYDNEISIRFEGPSIVDAFAKTLSAGTWTDQYNSFEIPMDGIYTIKAYQHISIDYDWGARNLYVYRTAGLTKWVAVTRDTATDYSYDGDSDKYGIDYLNTIKVFGDEKYNPTEYSWWWSSTLSTLGNDSLIVKTGRKSLSINYPTSSGSDTLSFIEGDNWGTDVYFSEKDFLNFWLFLENVNKLDTDFGDISFGVINDSNQIYYKWDIVNLSLVTGWNSVKLKFEDADSLVSTADDTNSIYRYINSNLNFRTNNRNIQSFRLRYRGKGQSFFMNIDDLNITRNVFDDDVKFGKGLYLTGHDYLNIPLSNMTLEKGAVEFWFKMTTDTYGLDKFGEIHSRTLFTIISNNNELVSLAIKSGYWFQPGAGHARRSLKMFDVDGTSLPLQLYFNIGDVVHLALVWSNDGSSMPNRDTVRFYINGTLLGVSRATWEVGDTKSAVIRLGGNSAQIAHNKDMYSSGLFDNVKLYNYCKTEFNPEMVGIARDVTYTPNQFIEISSDNSTFYGVDSANLPIVFEQVPDGESRTIYLRANKNENFKQSKKDASLIMQWIVSV